MTKSEKGFLRAALRKALSDVPPDLDSASEQLKERGFKAVCVDIKHTSLHTLYEIHTAGDDFVIKVTKED